MKERKDIVGRFDINFFQELKELAKFRYTKNLEKELPSIPEMTRLLRRTEGWKHSIFELKTKRRKEDV